MRIDPQTYCDDCWNKVEKYIKGVQDGSILVNKYVKLAIEKYLRMLNDKEEYVYRVSKVDKVFKFLSLAYIEHQDKYIQFPILDFQAFLISFIFGFYYKYNPEKRVIKEVFLFLSRKNGKTMFCSLLQLYGLLADNTENPQSILLALTAEQANISLQFEKNIINHTPEFKSRLIGQRSKVVFRDVEKQGFSKIMSSVKADRIEGTSPSFAIADELHGYENSDIINAIRTGTGARLNSLIFCISTAGVKNNSFCNDYLIHHQNVLLNKVKDDTLCGMLYMSDPEDDLSDCTLWKKSNPALGHIISLEDLKRSYLAAQHSIRDKFFFLTKHLNIFVDTPETWIAEDYLTPLFENFNEEEFIGHDVYIGMDLSKNIDLSSIVVYIPEKDFSYAVPFFWLANFEGNTIRKSGRDLSNWIYDKWITHCKSKTIDIDLIYDKIIELSEKYNIVSISYDPYNTPVLISRLKEAGLNCEKFQQTATKFNAPMKMLEEMIYNKKIKMKNPVLLYNFSNIVLYIDSNANVKIIKNKQADAVDGCVALAMAIGGYIQYTYGDELMDITSYINANKK